MYTSIIFKYFNNQDKYIFSKFRNLVLSKIEKNIYNEVRIDLTTDLIKGYNKINKFFDE